MPYTLVHPGFLLPLNKRWPRCFSLSAIIAGSIVPDLDILFRITNPRFHLFHFTATEILTLLWPISIIFSYYIDLILANFYLHEKPMPKALPILSSTLISILIHILLDSFVHPNAYKGSLCIFHALQINETQHLPLFQVSIISLQYLPQILISAIGLFLLFQSAKERVVIFMQTISDRKFLTIALPVSLIFFILKFFATTLEDHYFFDYLMLSGTASILVALTITPLFFLSSEPS